MNTDNEDLEPNTIRFTPSRRIQKKLDDLIREDREQEGRTWSYYQQMKKDNPDRYWKANTQYQMNIDAVELGDAFTDGDYHQ